MSNEVDLSARGGKSAIVIGGASGLGLAIVERFAHGGAHVTIADVDTEGGSPIVAELESKGLSATLVRCDVTDHASSVEAFEHAIRTSPSKSVDVAALVAGVIGEPGSLVDMVIKGQREEERVTPPQLRHPALDVNLLGIYNSAYLALCSTVAYTDVGNFADYHTSKFGIRGLFRGLRHETPRLDVRTNCLAPYFMDTPMVQNGLEVFAAAGMAPGKGFTFVHVDKVVDVACRFAVDESLHGRAMMIVPEPEGVIDVKDDKEGLWGGVVFKGTQERMRASGLVI
ncbi:hypothetical protein G647_05415 [Cladophialophora carrionii CBS 160.54]|uniref:Uncharacterized protein n=1 Tax=Cladophialophora carrionii CBS 160.54 TaxID=1279043 RepID=V9DBD8_9EURO|nr:uncharacterized protein G647_05415 [Cladophialophora carrionii CBS 160.54]ETI23613.1 hypothetical protein G647_05415 [Cladophialophora carrionii CBS 160.54]